MSDRDRLIRYVRRVFWQSDHTRWPTVRDCARALKLKMAAIEELADEGRPLMLTAYYTSPPQPLADHFVEICE